MRLKDWADRAGVKYLTAYRWFKDGSLPVKAYQTESGTIIVEDVDTNNHLVGNDVMSLFLKKTVEYSKSNATIEDFAAYILSTFSLKFNNVSKDIFPVYSRNKPKSEDVQKHFQQFLKPKGEKPAPNIFVESSETINDLVSENDKITTEDVIQEISKIASLSYKNKSSQSVQTNNLHVCLDTLSKFLIEPNIAEDGYSKNSFIPTQKELNGAESLIKSKNNKKKKAINRS